MTQRPVAPPTPGQLARDRALPEPDRTADARDPRPRVWIDQDLCTGDGLCAQLAPEVFTIHWDGLAYVHEGDGVIRDAPGATVPVDRDRVEEVVRAARECPGDCICLVAGVDGTVHGLPVVRERPGDTAT